MFRNYGKIISAGNLANRANNYLVQWHFKATDPTAYYTHHIRNDKIPQDPFELALLARHIVRKNESDAAILEKIGQSTKHSNLHKALEAEAAQYTAVLDDYVSQLKKVLAIQVYDLNAETLISTIYSFEKAGRSDAKFYEKYLLPELKQSLKHASLANLADLVEALNNGKLYSDKELWGSIADLVEAKTAAAKVQNVSYQGWDLDKYQLAEVPKKKKVTYRTENERYYADLVSSGESIANLKQEARKLLDLAMNKYVRRVFIKEARDLSLLDNFNAEVDNEQLISQLNEAARNVSEISNKVKKTVENLSKN